MSPSPTGGNIEQLAPVGIRLLQTSISTRIPRILRTSDKDNELWNALAFFPQILLHKPRVPWICTVPWDKSS